MKINIIVTSLFLSGGMRIIFEYGNRLTSRGHDVCLFYPFIPYKFAEDSLILKTKRYYWCIRDYILNKDIVRTAYECKFIIKGVPKVNNKFIRNADVTIATQWPTAYDVNNLSEEKGNKIYFLQDYEIWDSDKTKVDNALYLNLFKITISKYNQKFFTDNFNIHTHVILNGLEFSKYEVSEKSFNNKNKKTITFIDHPLNDKGTSYVIEVAKKLANYNENLNFICFGRKKYHDIPEFVRFYENPDDKIVINKILKSTDIFLYPSLKEGFALPPAEAMACKCAVITTPVGAVPEYAINNETAIFVNPENIDEMYNAALRLLENENEIQRISNNAYFYIRKVLNWEKSVDNFEKILINPNFFS